MFGMAPRTRPLEERFWEKVEKTAGCWLWRGAVTARGYGAIAGKYDPARRRATQLAAHRLSYELLIGPIPEGAHLDHLCRNPGCVNPTHLEPVTPRENILRSPVAPPALNALKHTCPRGHEYTPENTRIYKGRRHCRACDRERPRPWANTPEARERANRLRRERRVRAPRRCKGCGCPWDELTTGCRNCSSRHRNRRYG